MALDKHSPISDAIGNLYRASFLLASRKGEDKLPKELIQKSINKFYQSKGFKNTSIYLKQLVSSYYPLKSKKQGLILAEKILDQYLILK